MIAPLHPPQRELERRCDAVLDQILAWPEIPWSAVEGGRPGKPTHRLTKDVRQAIKHRDPALDGIRAWTALEQALYSTGVAVR